MSDTGRQSLSERVMNAITPDSAKKDSEILGQNVKGKLDKGAGYVEPEGEKSFTQKAADTIRDATEGSNSTGLQSKVNDVKESVARTINDASADPHNV
ncbi:hypothetical protein RI367_000078 [Sorochytrium milnesiophthora]